MKPLIKSNKLKLKKVFEKDLSEIAVDKNIMRLILDNIISNAIKYTEKGGTITVKIEKTQQNAVISVSDTGCGIPEQEHGKIFSKFYRASNIADKKTKGTGLGLYLAKKSAEEYGGDVWFESETNKGTTFHIKVPFDGMKKKKES